MIEAHYCMLILSNHAPVFITHPKKIIEHSIIFYRGVCSIIATLKVNGQV